MSRGDLSTSQILFEQAPAGPAHGSPVRSHTCTSRLLATAPLRAPLKELLNLLERLVRRLGQREPEPHQAGRRKGAVHPKGRRGAHRLLEREKGGGDNEVDRPVCRGRNPHAERAHRERVDLRVDGPRDGRHAEPKGEQVEHHPREGEPARSAAHDLAAGGGARGRRRRRRQRRAAWRNGGSGGLGGGVGVGGGESVGRRQRVVVCAAPELAAAIGVVHPKVGALQGEGKGAEGERREDERPPPDAVDQEHADDAADELPACDRRREPDDERALLLADRAREEGLPQDRRRVVHDRVDPDKLLQRLQPDTQPQLRRHRPKLC
mmetsp:Transcript_18631/g.58695  ORF Transcript_18631/g.58695 Transcript_18631/m.58695 type:complete len:322 (-) Transcript_18631:103-1068(-)